MYIIGLMSGTSLDGLDIAKVEISESESGSLSCQLLAAETIPYDAEWVSVLSVLENATALDYALANVRLGHYFGQCVNRFIEQHPGRVDLVASHGHTIFHQPELGLTTQIADGDAIAAETHLPVCSNFRTFDVALGGQGAPLVPIGDRLLFGDYDACLNLGGIANISYQEDSSNRRIAFDICPCNMALNQLALRLGKPYDKDGKIAASGRVLGDLLERMNALEYYSVIGPKSLGKEWVMESFMPLVSEGEVADLLCTTVAHETYQIAQVLKRNNIHSLLVTGGGALNGFFVESLRAKVPECRIIVPDKSTVDYKEAIVFALLGYLRVNHRVNTLATVTGAPCDSIGGVLSGVFE